MLKLASFGMTPYKRHGFSIGIRFTVHMSSELVRKKAVPCLVRDYSEEVCSQAWSFLGAEMVVSESNSPLGVHRNSQSCFDFFMLLTFF